MKKLYKYLLLFIVLIFGFGIKANAAVKFYEGDFIDDIYIKKIKNASTIYLQARFLQKSGDNTVAYCLDPFEIFSANDSYTSGNSYSKLSASAQEKIKLAAYYGYGFSTHTAKKWYVITQMIIWKYADAKGTYYFTDTLNGNKITTYDKDMSALESMMDRHYTTPSFSKKSYTMYLGEQKTLKDTNSVFETYSIGAVNGLMMSRSGNNLIVTGNKVGNYQIHLTKSNKRLSKNPVFYLTNGAQNLMTAGDVNDIQTDLNINVLGGSLKLVKYDADTKACKPSGQAQLKGTTYHLYKEDQLVSVMEINENCEANIGNLELGDYVLKEVKPGKGYLLDTQEYHFTIDKDHLQISLQLTDKVIKRKIILTKLYGNKQLEDYKVEPNVQFGIYDQNNQLTNTVTTNKSGQAEIELPYGSYTIKQLTSTKNYEYSPDITVNINESSDEEINFVLKNNIITTKLKVYKVNKKNKQPITSNPASFMIKDLQTGKYLYHTVDHKQTNIFTTNNEGYFLTTIDIPAGKYELIEVTAPYGYLIGKSLIFEIDEDKNFIYDSNSNKILEIFFGDDEEIKQTKVKVPDTQNNLNSYCWYEFLFDYYLYENKKYC